AWSIASRIAGRTHTEESRSPLQPYPSRLELAFSSYLATVRFALSGFALAKRAFGFGLGRALLPVSRKRLGLVCHGGQAMSSKSRPLPRPFAYPRQRESSRLVSGDRDHSCPDTQTHPGLG